MPVWSALVPLMVADGGLLSCVAALDPGGGLRRLGLGWNP